MEKNGVGDLQRFLAQLLGHHIANETFLQQPVSLKLQGGLIACLLVNALTDGFFGQKPLFHHQLHDLGQNLRQWSGAEVAWQQGVGIFNLTETDGVVVDHGDNRIRFKLA